MAMKKPMIKRRKRVIPMIQGSPESDDIGGPMDSIEAQSNVSGAATERGSMNPDGSVNLGSSGKQAMSFLPEPHNRSARTTSPSLSGDLAAYHTSHTSHLQTMPNSLNDENRLAPMTSLAATADRQSSLSPASFLSLSRKRSSSAAESDAPSGNEGGHDNSKRLSSIKSILNPAGTVGRSVRDDDYRENALPPIQSPGSSTASASSPGTFSNAAMTPSSGSARDAQAESEYSKAERRAALQRETERMREMLAAKERELAELGE
jgi:GATA-binding protein, other eukaryote